MTDLKQGLTSLGAAIRMRIDAANKERVANGANANYSNAVGSLFNWHQPQQMPSQQHDVAPQQWYQPPQPDYKAQPTKSPQGLFNYQGGLIQDGQGGQGMQTKNSAFQFQPDQGQGVVNFGNPTSQPMPQPMPQAPQMGGGLARMFAR